MRAASFSTALLRFLGQDEPRLSWEERLADRCAVAPSRKVADADLEAALHSERAHCPAMQSVLVAVLQVLERARAREVAAARATLSASQRDRIEELIEGLDVLSAQLTAALSHAGAQMRAASPPARPGEADDETLWWFALTEALGALEEGADCTVSLARQQEKDHPARLLAARVVRHLRRHHHVLLHEAEALTA